jgi:hypothetical protein
LLIPSATPSAALDNGAKIGFRFGTYRDAIICGMAQVFEYLGAFQEGFGRDATPIEANTTETFPLDNGGVHAELSGANGCYVAARAAADDNKVKVHVR